MQFSFASRPVTATEVVYGSAEKERGCVTSL